MPQSSRYSDEHVEKLLAELVSVLEKNRTPTDLSLMVLGNMVTNLINTVLRRHNALILLNPSPAPCNLPSVKIKRTDRIPADDEILW